MPFPLLRPSARRRCAVAALAVTAATLTGCGSGTTSTAGNTSPSAGPSSPEVTASATPSESTTPTPSASVTNGPGLTGRLIGAAEVPPLTPGADWTAGSTGDAGPQPFGACQEYDFATIGATRVVQRGFTADGGAKAVEQLAVFPDPANAARAGKVLLAFHDRCQKRLSHQLAKLRVGPVQQVPVSGGTASVYVASWVPPDDSIEGHVQAIGTVVRGQRIAVVAIDQDTTDGTTADAAATGAVRAAAAHLG